MKRLPVCQYDEKTKDIIIDGKRYASAAEAAKKLNVGYSTVRGWIASYGIRLRKKSQNVQEAKSLTVDGVSYPSVAEIARTYGLPFNTLAMRLKNFKDGDTVPVELCAKRLPHGSQTPKHGDPITIGGIIYKDAKDAAEQLGIPYSTLRYRTRDFNPDDDIPLKKVVTGRKMPQNGKKRLNRHSNPIRIGGVTYPSEQAAADALGLPYTTLRYRVQDLRGKRNIPLDQILLDEAQTG